MDDYYERLNQAFANWNGGGEPSLEQRVENLEAEIIQKQDILTFDSEPIEGSENPVTSGGVKTALAAKQDNISDLAAIRSGAAAGSTAVQPADMRTALAAKQDNISDLAAIRSGAAAGATAVQPAGMRTALAGKQDVLLYIDRTNTTTYSFSGLINIPDSTHFKYGIIIGGGAANNSKKAMVWFVFINTTDTVFFNKIIGDGAQTLTGSISDGVLTITSSETIYGGLRLLWFG